MGAGRCAGRDRRAINPGSAGELTAFADGQGRSRGMSSTLGAGRPAAARSSGVNSAAETMSSKCWVGVVVSVGVDLVEEVEDQLAEEHTGGDPDPAAELAGDAAGELLQDLVGDAGGDAVGVAGRVEARTRRPTSRSLASSKAPRRIWVARARCRSAPGR
jgi:hypothetical protein